MGSREVKGVDLNLFEANISVSDCKAAWVCPTETRPSACLRTVSGLEKGAILLGYVDIRNASVSFCAKKHTTSRA